MKRLILNKKGMIFYNIPTNMGYFDIYEIKNNLESEVNE